MPRSRGRGGRPFRRLLALVRATSQTCWRCGHLIDMTLDHQRDPMGSTLDHVIPLSLGGDPLDPANARHAHRRCNSKRGNRITRRDRSEDLPTSRAW
jgi:5-methylcytosine-specific restriction endonuclease McrA